MAVFREDDCFVAYSRDLDLCSNGETFEEALKNFDLVLKIFFDDLIKRGTLEEVLQECGWQKKHAHWIPPVLVAQTSVSVPIGH